MFFVLLEEIESWEKEMELENVENNSNAQYGVKKLVGASDEILADTVENSKPHRKWKIKCGKALFALRTSISKEFIDFVQDISSVKEVEDT
ncbi:hypothetical protein PVK06_026183 [Gossypium arboreum]|uniref:Uncharacterized protein n=1 Tax=Gossypium arboreum TaxID=29729 RepID=A0ABR0P0G3_GOSAR|nr:hypothetical protein PVK06_026183 [Gossypium arboreum]